MTQDLRLIISDKSSVVSTHPVNAQRVVDACTACGAAVKAVHVARDLGVDHSVRSYRRLGITQARFIKARSRLRQITGLAKITRTAVRLVRSAAYSQAFLGIEMRGLAPSAVIRFSSLVASATGIHHPGRCATTAILLSTGRHLLQEVTG